MSDDNNTKNRNHWPGYPVRVPLGVGRVLELSVEDKDASAGHYVLAVDAEHESIEIPCRTFGLALRSWSLEHPPEEEHLVVSERELVKALGDVALLGRRAAFAVDVAGAVRELRAIQRGLVAWCRPGHELELGPEEVADLLNATARALAALGEVPRG